MDKVAKGIGSPPLSVKKSFHRIKYRFTTYGLSYIHNIIIYIYKQKGIPLCLNLILFIKIGKLKLFLSVETFSVRGRIVKETANCPECGKPAYEVHSRYTLPLMIIYSKL